MNPSTIDDTEMQAKLQSAIGLLFRNDSFLLEKNVHERSVAHKLAEYLQQLWPEWNVDCEYDKKGLDPKRLDGINGCSEQRRTDRVLPDIVIHRRSSDLNLLVIEIKTKHADCECDYRKLELFTSENGVYKYRYGLFIRFKRLNPPEIKWYVNGAAKSIPTFSSRPVSS